MRLFVRGEVNVRLPERGCGIRCAVRPVSGAITRDTFAAWVPDRLRLLAPPDAPVRPGDRLQLLVDGETRDYVCEYVRAYPGHRALDAVRCL